MNMIDLGWISSTRDGGQPRRGIVHGRDGLPIPDHTGPLLDGQTMSVPMMLMDRQGQPGVRVSDAQVAREQMMAQMSTAWAHPSMNVPPSRPAGRSPLQWQPSPLASANTAEGGRYVAERHVARHRAHEAMVQHSQNAWRATPPKEAA